MGTSACGYFVQLHNCPLSPGCIKQGRVREASSSLSSWNTLKRLFIFPRWYPKVWEYRLWIQLENIFFFLERKKTTQTDFFVHAHFSFNLVLIKNIGIVASSVTLGKCEHSGPSIQLFHLWNRNEITPISLYVVRIKGDNKKLTLLRSGTQQLYLLASALERTSPFPQSSMYCVFSAVQIAVITFANDLNILPVE